MKTLSCKLEAIKKMTALGVFAIIVLLGSPARAGYYKLVKCDPPKKPTAENSQDVDMLYFSVYVDDAWELGLSQSWTKGYVVAQSQERPPWQHKYPDATVRQTYNPDTISVHYAVTKEVSETLNIDLASGAGTIDTNDGQHFEGFKCGMTVHAPNALSEHGAGPDCRFITCDPGETCNMVNGHSKCEPVQAHAPSHCASGERCVGGRCALGFQCVEVEGEYCCEPN